jgi:protein-disulfide isomerase
MEPQQQSSAVQSLSIPIAIVVAGALIAGAVYFSSSQTGGVGVGAPSVDIKDVSVTDATPYVGEKDAPVALAYWFDYQCPFCKAFDVGHPDIPIEPALPVLMKEYVAVGKLRILFKDFAFLGPDSTTAALYKNAVWDLYPEKFYEWHEAMYRAQDEENGGFGDEASILALIRTIPGLDADRITAQVTKKKSEYLERIEKDRAEGASFGINGTPGIITGTTLISGADTPSAFKAAIDAQL